MAQPGTGRPSRATGLPPGVEVGPLGRRFGAYLVEALVPAIVVVVLYFVLPNATTTVRALLSIVGALLVVGWSLLIWYMLAERAAGPGMRLTHLQLVGFYDGRPIGWVRVLLRALIFWVLSATGIGLLLLLVFLVLHPRKQGWHDLAAKAVVIKERVLAPPPRAGGAHQVAASPPRPPEREYTPPPMYGPSTSYSPVPAAPPSSAVPPSPAAPPSSAAPARPTPSAAPPPSSAAPARPTPAPVRQESPQSLVPPTGLGYPPHTDQPYAPVPPEQSAGIPFAPPSRSRPEDPGATETRPISTQPPDAQAPEDLNWHVVLDDGRRVVVDHLVLLGRNPQPDPGEEDAELIKIADETRTVSKLHVALGVDPAGLYVVDRGSTNGSTVTTPGGATRRCVPGETVYVSPGSIVSMGDHWLEVRRGTSS
jgi:uncharacterized RDD family membrane protein YckC